MTSGRASAHPAWQAGLLARDIRHISSRWEPPVILDAGRAWQPARGHIQRRVHGGFSPPSLTPAKTTKPKIAGDVNGWNEKISAKI
jgi:hypothetical protein